MLSRRQFMVGGLATATAGCAANPGSTLELFTKTVTGKSRSPDDYPLDAQQIHDLPYATLGVRIDRNPRAVVVLATAEDQELRWVSADHVSFYTYHGWLVCTRGLHRDLAATRWTEAGTPFSEFARNGMVPGQGVYREIDLGQGEERRVAVESRFDVVGEETLLIQGNQRRCIRIDEIANMREWRWETRNSFWISPKDGRVWRSVQRYCPEMPAIEMELLKPPAV